MEGFGGFFNDPDFQRRMQEMAEQMQSAQTLAWADNAIKLAVDLTVAAINRVNIQGTTEQQADQVRTVMATVFPEAVTLVRERGPQRGHGVGASGAPAARVGPLAEPLQRVPDAEVGREEGVAVAQRAH